MWDEQSVGQTVHGTNSRERIVLGRIVLGRNVRIPVNPSQRRSEPLGSFLSTSFDQQYALSLIGETSCLAVCLAPHRFFCRPLYRVHCGTNVAPSGLNISIHHKFHEDLSHRKVYLFPRNANFTNYNAFPTNCFSSSWCHPFCWWFQPFRWCRPYRADRPTSRRNCSPRQLLDTVMHTLGWLLSLMQ